MSIRSSTFPTALKMAEVVPIFKKGDNMDKTNYRPVSILPSISKIFEQALLNQLSTYFDTIFSPHLSGFRKGHGCQNVLMDLVENCKDASDQNMYTGAILMDLSKAFDCLPH